VFFVIEGTGRLTVGEDSVLAAENTTIHVPHGIQRAWTNAGNTPFRILVYKLPNAG
jgi:mannose-6-phosphate isomerase-like protein (cupin superfamily)